MIHTKNFVSVEQAKEYLQEHKRNKAINILNNIIKHDKSNLEAWRLLAQVYHSLNKWTKAKETAQKYIKLGGKDWIVYYILADVLFFEGFFEEALVLLKKLLKRSDADKNAITQKIDQIQEKFEKVINKPKLAFITANDSFLDDIVSCLSEEFWVRKYIIPSSEILIHKGAKFLASKGLKIFSKVLTNIYEYFSRGIYKAIDWADIVWLEWANEVAIIGTNYNGAKNKKVIVRLHRYEAFTNYIKQINWNVVDKLILVSSMMGKAIESVHPDVYSKIKDKIEIIYNGLDVEKIPFKEREPGYNIAWVAHIHSRKNPMLALQIISRLIKVDSRYKLHVAGDFQDKMLEIYLKYMVEEMGLENNVIFYGWVDDMDEWWEDKNYLLSTSVHESFGYNIAEAMARGIKPVIHNFFGAYELWPKKNIFNTIDEAVEMIISGEYESEKYREFVEKYSLDKQIRQIKEIIVSIKQSKHYSLYSKI